MDSLTRVSIKLDTIKNKLKGEFIGLDEIIDQLIQAVNPWCTMSESQSRPLVVNLWGMTGVGKTSLVRRFLELWDKEQSVIPFNMGSQNNFRDVVDSLENMIILNGTPTVFIFDEFQHAKTLEEDGKELKNPLDRMIWQLLDNGKFNFIKLWLDSNDLKELVMGLELCLDRGVKVEKGKVVEGWKTFENIMGSNEHRYNGSSSSEERNFISRSDLNIIHETMKIEFPFKAVLREYIYQMDGPGILNFLKRVEKNACLAKEIDFSKSLIFVIGNLDEAFEMSHWVSADHDPDILFYESKKITFSTIKEALKERFRMEEISRLGNVHLIYPALRSQVYRDFIDWELKAIAKRFENTFQCQLVFSKAVKDMLFEEGVVPTQGFRPLRSSIRYIIESSLVDLLQRSHFEPGSELSFDMDKDTLVMKHHDAKLGCKKLHLPVREARSKKLSPQNMAITAVHEAGHALLYSILWGKLPKLITIASSDFTVGGFMQGDHWSDFENHDELIRDIAVKLAGKKAEQMVFGKENITRGCEYDIKEATRKLLGVYREGSMTHRDVAYESKRYGKGKLLTENKDGDLWVMDNLDKAGKLAAQLLEKHIDIFKAFVELLLEKKYVTADTLEHELRIKGIDISKLLNAYPPPVDYAEKLNLFLGNEKMQTKYDILH